jgi:hypothetical protein
VIEQLEQHVDFDVPGNIMISRSSGSLGFHIWELPFPVEVAEERQPYTLQMQLINNLIQASASWIVEVC